MPLPVRCRIPPAQPARAKIGMVGGGRCVFLKTSWPPSRGVRNSIASPPHRRASLPTHCAAMGETASILRWNQRPPTGNTLWRACVRNRDCDRCRLFTTRPTYIRRLNAVAISRTPSSAIRPPRFLWVRTPINSRRYVARAGDG